MSAAVNGHGVNVTSLLDMLTDIAPALAERGRVTVDQYGSDVWLRLNGHCLMVLPVETGAGWLVAKLREMFK